MHLSRLGRLGGGRGGKIWTYHNAQAFTTGNNTKAIEKADEEHLCRPRQSSRQIYQYRKQKTGPDLKRYFERDICRQKCFNTICTVIIFAIEYVFFIGVDSDILQHADEVESTELLDKSEARLNRVVVIMKGCEKKGEYDCQA